MKYIYYLLLFVLIIIHSCNYETNQNGEIQMEDDLMIRIAEIEVHSNYFDEYIKILKEEAAKSMKLEEGVLCIYPMFETKEPTRIKLLEIYANEESYKAHLNTPHFLHYKTITIPMVKSLKLIDMEAIDKKTMQGIFRKMN